MDSGLISVVVAYFRAYWSRLGDQREQAEAQDSNGKPKENVSQRTESQTVEPPRPACGSVGRGISCLLLALLLGGCASVNVDRKDVVAAQPSASASRASGGDAVRPGVPGVSGTTTSFLSTMELPVCGFEAPYLPDPCRLEVTPGEWLRISNPKPKETKKHGWLWWLLISLVTI